jgi:hypothetical protein
MFPTYTFFLLSSFRDPLCARFTEQLFSTVASVSKVRVCVK